MNGKTLKTTLAQGNPIFGIALEGYGQPRWPRFFNQIGLDFVFLDSEHTPQNRETIAWAVQAYAANHIAPLLRIPEASPTLAAMGLDAGAHGIIVPYVETVEQVKAVVGAVKYRPLKGQALTEAVESGHFPNEETRQYLTEYNQDTVLVIMIESPAGVANLDELLSIAGVDAVLMGPHDLSVSHGVPEQYDHPIFLEAAQQVIATSKTHGVGVGMHYTTEALGGLIQWLDWGCNFICQHSDTLYIARGAIKELDRLHAYSTDSATDKPDDSSPDLGAAGHAT
ncbi:HpcH/HpaI aldolase/citrate lyase family protein [Chloroflexota bacterium]